MFVVRLFNFAFLIFFYILRIHFFRKDDSLAEKVFYPAAKLSAAGKHTMAHVANLVRDLDSL